MLTTIVDETIIQHAFRAPNGELAWPSAHVVEAVDALQRGGLAILGGEVWVVSAGGVDAQPRLKEGRTSVISWDTEKRGAEESWAQYVRRAAAETLAAIRDMNAEDAVAPELREKLFYCLCYVPESGG